MSEKLHNNEKKEISAIEEKQECAFHLFVPDILYPWKVVNADRAGEWVEYDGGKNWMGGRIESY